MSRLPILAPFLIALPLFAHASPSCPQFGVQGQLPALVHQQFPGRTTPLCNGSYALLDADATRAPLWSAEHLTRDEVKAAERLKRHGQFHEDTRLPIEARSELEDYRRSGFDRGHMTPSGDAPTEALQAETFALSNVVPQTNALNSGPWSHIEQMVRNLALRDGEVYVVTGPAYHSSVIATIGPDHVKVPTSTWKAVYDPKTGGAGVYVCRNEMRSPPCSQVTVATLIRVTGVDPFPALSADVKARPYRLPDGRHRQMNESAFP
ncbi:hypothetical protein GLI01_23470 [Gluconacetobacter liquefaciens]|uniref:Endonuclease n=1 Tax=Gluconacetobacter liquefaciens TaxID=89584 RepID=A0A370G332_GLULI|nr:DNA/RNA non-specific endonuclease [Gluconacetobacter liquefaciens]MBB2186488.1 DNA/RNA non-specific endonuclease [Gluconacetobacter liquefaciens]RDI38155.1 endonuclease G [Gluconacetobacter liquefaciens]GBQ98122.1 endonuclease [Gluconacetobacter liquefaciens NRIC 0522]GEB38312.1 hypothetical protein GLI01_23470 [Gluconacetobacter liquefaciens]